MFYILIAGTEQHSLIKIKNFNSNIKEMLDLLIPEYFDWMNPSIVTVLEGNITYKDNDYKVYDIVDLVEEVKNKLLEDNDVTGFIELLGEEDKRRIDLRKEQVKEILPILQRLVNSGEI